MEGHQDEGDGSSSTREYNEGQQQPSDIRLPRGGVDKETVPPGGIRMREVVGGGSDWRHFIFGYNADRGGVAEAGNSVLTWQSKMCAITGKMGMVGVIDDGTMEMVAVDGYAAEIQDYKGQQREEYIQVDEGGGVTGRLRQQQKRCFREAGQWGQQKRRQMMGTAANEDGRREDRQLVQRQQRHGRESAGILGGETLTASHSVEYFHKH